MNIFYRKYGQRYKSTYYLEERADYYTNKFKRDIEPYLDIIQQWLDEGEPISEIVKRLHTSNQLMAIYRNLIPTFGEMFERAIEKRKSHDVKCKTYTYNPSSHRETLCWRCNNIVPNPNKNKGCEWSVQDKPVPGWIAKETKLNIHGRCVTSYCVYDCPKFKRLERGEI